MTLAVAGGMMRPMPPQPLLSVFTPSHNVTWLNECYESLAAQTYPKWEWVVVLNGGARWDPPVVDERVRVLVLDQLRGVGAAKAYACQWAQGELLAELDHDDYLLPDALSVLAKAFRRHKGAALFYSDFAQVDAHLREMPAPFSAAHGWEYQPALVTVGGEERKVLQTRALDASLPHNASYIWYAPNHVRAFTRLAYDKAGGYDVGLDVLDDQDLMNRLYRVGEFVHVPGCHYLQRWTGQNTQAEQETNARIQTGTVEQYDLNVQANALAWAARNGLAALDLGSAHNKPDGYIGVDLYEAPGVDEVGDVFDVLARLGDNSVGVIRAVDFLEHIGPEPDKRIRLFNEMHRVLAHGGMLLSLTPSSDGRGAFQDPTHVSFYNENSFWYYTHRDHQRFVPSITARFQVSRMSTTFPDDWHRDNLISYVNANLIAIKPDGARLGGLNYWPDEALDD